MKENFFLFSCISLHDSLPRDSKIFRLVEYWWSILQRKQHYVASSAINATEGRESTSPPFFSYHLHPPYNRFTLATRSPGFSTLVSTLVKRNPSASRVVAPCSPIFRRKIPLESRDSELKENQRGYKTAAELVQVPPRVEWIKESLWRLPKDSLGDAICQSWKIQRRTRRAERVRKFRREGVDKEELNCEYFCAESRQDN